MNWQPQQKGEPLFDFPCSYTFRALEALENEGLDLPHLKEGIPARISKLERKHPIDKPSPKGVDLQLQINTLNRIVKEHIQRSIKPRVKRQDYIGTEIDETPSNPEDKRI